MKYELVGQMAEHFPVKPICEALEVGRSGFYAQRNKPKSPRRVRDEQLGTLIVDAFVQSRGAYGSPRIQRELAYQGERCGKNRVARLMREKNIRPKQKRKFRPMTTQSDPGLPIAPNWAGQIPKPDRPNQIWTTDITYVATGEGWLYLAGHMDYFSRKIIGWATSESLETALVERSLHKALASRRPDLGLVHHSDRGCQYASHHYRRQLADNRITASMSRKGNCYDNAAQESFWATCAVPRCCRRLGSVVAEL